MKLLHTIHINGLPIAINIDKIVCYQPATMQQTNKVYTLLHLDGHADRVAINATPDELTAAIEALQK